MANDAWLQSPNTDLFKHGWVFDGFRINLCALSTDDPPCGFPSKAPPPKKGKKNAVQILLAQGSSKDASKQHFTRESSKSAFKLAQTYPLRGGKNLWLVSGPFNPQRILV